MRPPVPLAAPPGPLMGRADTGSSPGPCGHSARASAPQPPVATLSHGSPHAGGPGPGWQLPELVLLWTTAGSPASAFSPAGEGGCLGAGPFPISCSRGRGGRMFWKLAWPPGLCSPQWSLGKGGGDSCYYRIWLGGAQSTPYLPPSARGGDKASIAWHLLGAPRDRTWLGRGLSQLVCRCLPEQGLRCSHQANPGR